MTVTFDARRAVLSTYIAFFGAGLLMATWASRIPGMKNALALDSGTWGLVLLAIAAGSISALPSAGPIINRLGAKTSVRLGSALSAISLIAAGFGYLVGAWPVVIGLYLMGFGFGLWDVSMNVHGAQAERHIHRSIMSRFHAGYSIGTVIAALFGALMVALSVPIYAHFTLVGLGTAIAVICSVSGFLPPEEDPKTPAPEPTNQTANETTDAFADPLDTPVGDLKRKTMLEVWREPRTLAIGLFVLVFAFAEGSAIDWVGLAMIEDHGAEAAYGTLGLAIFLATMTVTRWFGPNMLDRYGRVVTLRVLAVVTLVGSLAFIFAPTPNLAFVGAAVWGVGVALGFPVGMSAAGDEPLNAAMRVSVVASIAYAAFLGGPPLIGLLAQRSDVLHALLAVAVLVPLGFLLAGFLREPKVDPKIIVEGGAA